MLTQIDNFSWRRKSYAFYFIPRIVFRPGVVGIFFSIFLAIELWISEFSFSIPAYFAFSDNTKKRYTVSSCIHSVFCSLYSMEKVRNINGDNERLSIHGNPVSRRNCETLIFVLLSRYYTVF